MPAASRTESYSPIEGSERALPAAVKLLGLADPDEVMSVTVFLRQRRDAEPLPDFSYYATTPPAARPRLSDEEFAALYGASDDDIARVVEFARSHGLSVIESHAARRTIVVRGTVSQMSRAFHVELRRYEHSVRRRRHEDPRTEEFRGREGAVYVPDDLSGVILGVFGLDNRRITKSNTGDPPNTRTITVPSVRGLYNFPTNSAAGQTIAIFSERGYQKQDITNYFASLPSCYPAPTVTDVSVDATNDGSADPETTQDICIAATAAPGAEIVVYFTSYTQQGWVDLFMRVANPGPGDPRCSVLSSSFYVSDGDDLVTLRNQGITTSWLSAVDIAFQHCVFQGTTVCVASGDGGSGSKQGDGKAHVQFPASDPYVLSVGGTTVGNITLRGHDEYVWNDTFGVAPNVASGATGGGVSDYFALPIYQAKAGVPKSVNDGHVGRAVPDVAANASPNSGYPLKLANNAIQVSMDGTSASAPLWAGLIAVLNAAIGANLGFVNSILYAIAPAGFRDVVGAPGPVSNALGGAPGYPARRGCDACTGWGSPDGAKLLEAIREFLVNQEAAACANVIPGLGQVLAARAPRFTNSQFAATRALIQSCAARGYLTGAQVSEADELLAEIASHQHSGGQVPQAR